MRIRLLFLLGLLVLAVAACGGDRTPGSDLPSVSQLPPPDDDGSQPPAAAVPPAPAAPAVAAPVAAAAPVPAAAPVAPVATTAPTAAPADGRFGWSAGDYAFLEKRIPLYERSLDRFLNMGNRTVAAETLAGSIERQRAAAGSAAQQALQLKNEVQALQQQLAVLRSTEGAVDLTQFGVLASRLTQLELKLTALDARVQKLLQMRVSPQSNWPR